jgi:NADH-quinone oxidoreductase subunit L
MTTDIPSYLIWLIFSLPLAGALVTAALHRAGRIRDYIAVLLSFASACLAFVLLLPVLEGQTYRVVDSIIPQSIPWISGLGLTVGVLSDPYTIILANVVAWISFLIMLYSLEYMKDDAGVARYFFFISLFVGSMQLIVLSDNFLSLFIGWEMVGLCSYALIGHFYKDETKDWVGTPGEKALGEEQAYPPTHAGMKAFVMTRVGDVAMLAGLLIFFYFTHTFNYHQLAATSSSWVPALSNSGLLVPVALLIFGGAIGKSAQFPLHEWLPDAMAGPAPVSALIHAATMVNSGVVLVARVAPLFFFSTLSNTSMVQPFFLTVAWIGAFSAFLAATQALVGFELKKILAYSTISQIGYMMLAMGVAGLSTSTGFVTSLSAGLYQLMSHAIFKACLFLAAGALIHAADSKYISDMGGLAGKMKLTFAAVLIAAASLSGIPPFSGFWSKDAVLGAAWSSGQYGLFIAGAATAALTAFYSFRMLGLVFFGKRSARLVKVEEAGHHVHEPSPLMWVPYVLLAGITVLLGLTALVGYAVPGLNIEASLESASTSYIQGLFPGQALPAPGGGFNVPASGIAGLFVAIGFALAAAIYIMKRVSPSRFVGQTGVMHGLYVFLEKRWYINAIYYKVFVNAPLAAADWLNTKFDLGGMFRVNNAGPTLGISLSAAGNWLDTKVVDGVANGVSSVGQFFSRALRRLQSGIVEDYVFVFALGIIVLMILLLLTSGVHLP